MLRLSRLFLSKSDIQISYFKESAGNKLRAKGKFLGWAIVGWGAYEVYLGDSGAYKNVVMPIAPKGWAIDGLEKYGFYPRIVLPLPENVISVKIDDNTMLKNPIGVFGLEESVARKLVEKNKFSFVQTEDSRTIDNCLSKSKMFFENKEVDVVKIDIPEKRSSGGGLFPWFFDQISNEFKIGNEVVENELIESSNHEPVEPVAEVGTEPSKLSKTEFIIEFGKKNYSDAELKSLCALSMKLHKTKRKLSSVIINTADQEQVLKVHKYLHFCNVSHTENTPEVIPIIQKCEELSENQILNSINSGAVGVMISKDELSNNYGPAVTHHLVGEWKKSVLGDEKIVTKVLKEELNVQSRIEKVKTELVESYPV
jgi:hypothetical protein